MYNIGFEEFDEGGSKSLPDGIYQPYMEESFSVNVEPEYAVIDDNNQFAYITLQENNGVAVLDIDNKEIVNIFSLGSHDFSLTGLDASDRDNAINIATYSQLYGLRMPDVIDYFIGDNGREYILTANEGDSKDFDESRVADITLDPDAFPDDIDLMQLQLDENLGRLKIINQLGLNETSGLFKELYAFSSRDFTVLEIMKDGNGKINSLDMVFSSLDEFESITADSLGTVGFNANTDFDSFDARSDDKGPEPETLIVGKCTRKEKGKKRRRRRRGSKSSDSDDSDESGDKSKDKNDEERVYVFIGLERVGGIMVYDMTDIKDIEFVQYLNSRDFDVEYEEDTRPPEDAGDVAPEQLRYIEGDVYGVPLLFAAYTESSSIAIYKVNCGCDKGRRRGCN